MHLWHGWCDKSRHTHTSMHMYIHIYIHKLNHKIAPWLKKGLMIQAELTSLFPENLNHFVETEQKCRK